MYNLVENHFKTISVLTQNKEIQKFRSSIVPLAIVDRLINHLSEDPSVLTEDSPHSVQKLDFHNAAFLITKVLKYKHKTLSRKQRLQIKQSEQYKQKISEYEEKSMKLAPQIEKRIICIRDQKVV